MATVTDPRDIILAPVISEKSYGLIEDNVYTFVVHPDSNKTQIKIAVEKAGSFDGLKVMREIHKLKEVMKESVQLGMKTFDQSLFELYQAGEISYDDALRYADSQNEVRLRIKLSQGGDARTLSQVLDGVEISEIR